MPMKCPKCSGTDIRASSTNSTDDQVTVRKRVCHDCGHMMFTVELEVHKAFVGWDRTARNGASKPTLRVPLEMALENSGT